MAEMVRAEKGLGEQLTNDVWEMYRKGDIRPYNSRFYDLSEVNEALDSIRNRMVLGKAMVVTEAFWERYPGMRGRLASKC